MGKASTDGQYHWQTHHMPPQSSVSIWSSSLGVRSENGNSLAVIVRESQHVATVLARAHSILERNRQSRKGDIKIRRK